MAFHHLPGSKFLDPSITFFLLFLNFSITITSVSCAYMDDVPRCMGVITSDVAKNGTISSPGYPSYYPPRTHCRYDFVGKPRERVQIIFTDFNLYHPDEALPHERGKGHGPMQGQRNQKEKDCSGEDVDVLSAFTFGADDMLDRIDDYCGSATPIAIMSSRNKLTLEFNAPNSSQYVRGFSALYSFVEDFSIKTGKQDPNYPCRFIYNSTETSNGTITSPNYPGLYPRDTECHYFFNGKDNEHVEVHFTYFHVDGVQPCDEDTYSDYVELSNYIPIDRKYDRKCGTIENGFKVKSDRKFFRVNFKSNNRYDATGFQATYQFTDKENRMTIRNIRNDAVQICFQLLALIPAFFVYHY